MADRTKPQSVNGIHHLKLPCQDILKTGEFYVKHLAFTRLHEYNHYTPDHKLFAIILKHEPTGLCVELRYSPRQASLQKGWDPITWGVGTRADLEKWGMWLDAQGVRRSKVLTAISAWTLVFEDPDERFVRLYVTDEEHEWTDNPERDEEWLGTVEANIEQESQIR